MSLTNMVNYYVSFLLSASILPSCLKPSYVKLLRPNIVLRLKVALERTLRKYEVLLHKTLFTAKYRSSVKGGFRKNTTQIWGSFAQNLVYGHFQQHQSDSCSMFTKRVCTGWKGGTLSRVLRHHMSLTLQSCFFDQAVWQCSANSCQILYTGICSESISPWISEVMFDIPKSKLPYNLYCKYF